MKDEYLPHLSFLEVLSRYPSMSAIMLPMRFSSLYAGTTMVTRREGSSLMEGKGARVLRRGRRAGVCERL